MNRVKLIVAAIALTAMPGAALAQAAAPGTAPVAAPAATAESVPAQPVPAPAALKPVEGVGQPIPGGIGLQMQVTPEGEEAQFMHDWILMPVMVGISLLVLALMLWVVIVYRRAANPVPSKTTHNTTIEVIWTLVPVLILVGIAVPSISLLARQYRPAPADALTIKAIGNQWNWGYEYPDHGIEFTANMLSDEAAAAAGEPRLLAVDNRVVVPVGRTVRLLVTANDVIHSWAMPAFWIKMDAVPGRINEVTFKPEKTGVYYGQCSELCGARHAFMPIAVEVVPEAQFRQWVAAQGGTMPGATPAPPAAPAVTPAAPTAAVTNSTQG